MLHVRGGKVLLQRNRFGERFLARLDRLHARGPKRLPSDERTAIRVWARKMLDRIKVGDVEARFRRLWLLTTLLEDYFLLRGRWYEGPKLALQWLRENEPETYRLFEKALKRPTNLTAIKALVDAVVE